MRKPNLFCFLLLLIAAAATRNVTECFSSFQSVGGANGTAFQMFDSLTQIQSGNLTYFNTTASVSIVRVCANATTNFITGFKARLADSSTGSLVEDSRPVGDMVGNCTNIYINNTAGDYIKNITVQYTSTSLYQLTFFTNNGTRTTVGRQYAGTKTKVYQFNDSEARFVGFNGTYSRRVTSLSPQTYNSTCLAEIYANETEETSTDIDSTETDSTDPGLSENTTEIQTNLTEIKLNETDSDAIDSWMSEQIKALTSQEIDHKRREKRLLIIILCSIGGFLLIIVAVALIQTAYIRAKNRKQQQKPELKEPKQSSSSFEDREQEHLDEMVTPHVKVEVSERSESISQQSEPESSVKKPDRTEQELLHHENVINTETELSCNAPSEDLEVSNLSAFENEKSGFDMKKQKSGITS